MFFTGHVRRMRRERRISEIRAKTDKRGAYCYRMTMAIQRVVVWARGEKSDSKEDGEAEGQKTGTASMFRLVLATTWKGNGWSFWQWPDWLVEAGLAVATE